MKLTQFGYFDPLRSYNNIPGPQLGLALVEKMNKFSLKSQCNDLRSLLKFELID